MLLKSYTEIVWLIFTGVSVMLFNTILSYIVVVSFIGGGNQRKTCRKSLTNFIT
jgi:hypothetical protein